MQNRNILVGLAGVLVTSLSGVIVFGSLFSACSGSGTGVGSSSATISGSGVAGVISGGLVTAYPLNADGSVNTNNPLGAATTSSTGTYTLTLPAQSAPIALQLGSGTYTEEGSGNPVTLSQKKLTTILPTPTSTTISAAITPLTDMAAQVYTANAKTNYNAGTTLTASVLSGLASSANFQVGSAFGLTDIVGTIPPSTNGTLSSGTGGQYAVALAALSSVANTAGTNSVALANAYATSLINSGTLSSTTVSVTDQSGNTVSVTTPSAASLNTTMGKITAGTLTLVGAPNLVATAVTAPVAIVTPPAGTPGTPGLFASQVVYPWTTGANAAVATAALWSGTATQTVTLTNTGGVSIPAGVTLTAGTATGTYNGLTQNSVGCQVIGLGTDVLGTSGTGSTKGTNTCNTGGASPGGSCGFSVSCAAYGGGTATAIPVASATSLTTCTLPVTVTYSTGFKTTTSTVTIICNP